MNCEEIEKMIYLVDELNEDELLVVHKHIVTCPSCEGLLRDFREDRVKIRMALSVDLSSGPVKLTDRIMAAIDQAETKTPFQWFEQFLWSAPAKYAVAAISIFLVAFFISEYSQSAVDSKSFYTGKPISVVKRNSATDQYGFLVLKDQPRVATSLFQILRERHDEKVSFLSKVKDFKLKQK